MMEWRPPGYRFVAEDLVKALCADHTDQALLLLAAASGHVELFAESKAWNEFLRLVMSTFRLNGNPVYTGQELGSLKASLPIVWI